jgi:hypothetical protein
MLFIFSERAMDWWPELTPEQWKLTLDTATLTVASIGAAAGLWQYRKAQRWKRSEFVASEVTHFTSDPPSRNAMLMLDWGSRRIDLFPYEETPERRFVRIDRPLLQTALLTHDQIGRRYTDVEAAVRDCFDAYFGSLDRFHQFIEAGLISEADVRPYLEYWVTTIDRELEPIMQERIRDYVTFYRFTGAQSLLTKLGASLWTADGRQPPQDRLPILEMQDQGSMERTPASEAGAAAP